MLQNYLKLALRNLAKNKFFSLINILGLALGMSSCLTVILIIRDQFSYDKFHPAQERLFRVNCEQEDGMRLACLPYPTGETLTKEYNVAEASVRLIRGIFDNDATTASNVTLPVSGFYTEPSFFDVFGFKLEAGNAATALSEPNTLVLSEKMAKKLFTTTNPIGESIVLKNKGMYKITGIMAEEKQKSHLIFDCLVSVSSLKSIEAAMKPEEAQEKILDNWSNWYSSYCYVRLRPDQSKNDLNNALTLLSRNREKVGDKDKKLKYFTQNISEITPRNEQLANDIGGGAPMFFMWGLAAFVLILTIFPCLNYANMAISQALSRTREVGVRKAIGAKRSDVQNLMLTESVLTAFFALGVAWLLHLPINHFVLDFFPPQANLQEMKAGPSDWVIFVLFALLVGLLAGWIPARRLAKIEPSYALRGSTGVKNNPKRFSWRSAMLVGQFAASLIFMVLVATLWSQMHYMTLADYGFQKENLLTIEMQGNKPLIVAQEMMQVPQVKGVAMTTSQIASNNLQGMPLYKTPGGEDLGAHCALVDENYIPVLDLKMVAGENFLKNKTATKEELLIINEKAVERFQLGSANDAVGKTLWLNDSTPAQITGVLRDFHYRILENGIEPFALRYSPRENGHIMHVRLSAGDPQMAMAALGSVWKKIDTVHPLKATFMEDSIQKAYGHVTLVGGIISFFAVLSLILACMGLLGSVTYSVSTKVKEIGVRKVLGASTHQVIFQLSKRFLLLLAMAILIALPLGYLASSKFLTIFAYRIDLNGVILGGSAAAMLLLGLLTIGLQASRAALANPVEALRSE
jgi:putative ABC transport system permease protein